MVLQLLNGLGPEFYPVVSGITSRDDSLTLESIQALLMAHESPLERHQTMSDLSNKMDANITFGPSRNGPFAAYRSTYNYGRSSNYESASRNTSRGFSRGPPISVKLLCQVYLKSGHTAAVCHYRFDKTFITPKAGTTQPRVYLIEQEIAYDPQAYVTSSLPNFGDDGCWMQTQAPPIMLHMGWNIWTLQFLLLGMKLSLLVMDKQSGRVLLKRKVRDVLYMLGEDTQSSQRTSLECHLGTHSKSSSAFFVPSDSCLPLTVPSCTRCSVKPNSKCNHSSINKEHVYTFCVDSVPQAYSCTVNQDVNIWHSKHDHPSSRVVSKILSHIPNSSSLKHLKFCDACQKGKSHKLPFPVSSSRVNQSLALIHTDLWGPAHVASKEGYYVHLEDDYSRFTWIFSLTLKSQAFDVFIQFNGLVEKKFGLPIKSIQADWEGEYRVFEHYLGDQGIKFQHPCPHTHEQNGRA
ncbi:uncharacterized protein LOC133823277 isoform X1 [Humulus lupulus]|uniref:uncharacterized protein LOC133823277 isoform X1 n=1 Tax=Humulus lupulus TaxID=3486 RepID=UPI002B401096|nr:uncharacterized protein LOC133823277 isoform X1 [Humulus lupulus]